MGNNSSQPAAKQPVKKATTAALPVTKSQPKQISTPSPVQTQSLEQVENDTPQVTIPPSPASNEIASIFPTEDRENVAPALEPLAPIGKPPLGRVPPMGNPMDLPGSPSRNLLLRKPSPLPAMSPTSAVTKKPVLGSVTTPSKSVTSVESAGSLGADGQDILGEICMDSALNKSDVDRSPVPNKEIINKSPEKGPGRRYTSPRPAGLADEPVNIRSLIPGYNKTQLTAALPETKALTNMAAPLAQFDNEKFRRANDSKDNDDIFGISTYGGTIPNINIPAHSSQSKEKSWGSSFSDESSRSTKNSSSAFGRSSLSRYSSTDPVDIDELNPMDILNSNRSNKAFQPPKPTKVTLSVPGVGGFDNEEEALMNEILGDDAMEKTLADPYDDYDPYSMHSHDIGLAY